MDMTVVSVFSFDLLCRILSHANTLRNGKSIGYLKVPSPLKVQDRRCDCLSLQVIDVNNGQLEADLDDYPKGLSLTNDSF